MTRIGLATLATLGMLVAGTAWGQGRATNSVRTISGSRTPATQVSARHLHHDGGCSTCGGSECGSCGQCGGCGDCFSCGYCGPRVIPAIAGSIHAVADHVADRLSCLFPCYHRRWACCQPLWDGCCPQTCCRDLWTPAYRNCSGPCGGMQIPEGIEGMHDAPIPVPDKGQGAHRKWSPDSTTMPSSIQRSPSTASRRAASATTVRKGVPTKATPRKLKLEQDDSAQAAASYSSAVEPAKKIVRRASNESGADRLAPSNPLRQ
ncbi:MAG: hypothetical protein FJ295_02935 [Planctomycetes bacterium]|nr:hypothetical protein [Planctomycetota bacterium]